MKRAKTSMSKQDHELRKLRSLVEEQNRALAEKKKEQEVQRLQSEAEEGKRMIEAINAQMKVKREQELEQEKKREEAAAEMKRREEARAEMARARVREAAAEAKRREKPRRGAQSIPIRLDDSDDSDDAIKAWVAEKMVGIEKTKLEKKVVDRSEAGDDSCFSFSFNSRDILTKQIKTVYFSEKLR